MVHVERNPPESLRNGRSRGPSPNGHAGGSPDSSDDDSTKNNKSSNKSTKAKSEYEEKIRVGKDFQTTCPDLIPPNERRLEALNDRALLVWSPTKDIPDSKLEEYITVAKEKYGYNGEQALGMLFWHKHDLERAVMDLANFTPFPDEWTDEDKVLFEQAFHFHGKSFHRIRQMLPDKNIASLVKYYYSWKKTRSRTSVMDRQEKNKIKEGSENGSENGSNEESDTEEKIQNNKQIVSSLKRKNSENLDDLYPPENGPRVVSRWNNDELSLAVKGVRKYGKDFQAIAELLGTKSESQVRTFFVNYRRKFNLDAIVKEFELKQLKEEKLEQIKTTTDDTSTIATSNSTVATTTSGAAQSNEMKTDTNSKATEDDLMEIDLIDDIPNSKDDDDIEEVSIIENEQSLSYPGAKQSNGTVVANATTESADKIDSISNSNITSSTINTNTIPQQLQSSSNGSIVNVAQTVSQQESPQSVSSAGTINISTTAVTTTGTSSTSAVLVPTVEPAKAAV